MNIIFPYHCQTNSQFTQDFILRRRFCQWGCIPASMLSMHPPHTRWMLGKFQDSAVKDHIQEYLKQIYDFCSITSRQQLCGIQFWILVQMIVTQEESPWRKSSKARYSGGEETVILTIYSNRIENQLIRYIIDSVTYFLQDRIFRRKVFWIYHLSFPKVLKCLILCSFLYKH